MDASENEIKAKIISALRGHPEKRMFVAKLGQIISKETGGKISDMLSGRKLSEFINSELNEEVYLGGAGDRLTALLKQTESPTDEPDLFDDNRTDSTGRRYQRRFFAAFIVNARRGRVRAIRPELPYEWADFDSTAGVPAGWLIIDGELIPGDLLSWSAKKAAAAAAIERWCAANKLDPGRFIATGDEEVRRDLNISEWSSAKGASVPALNIEGARSLLRLIEHIPDSERRSYSFDVSFLRAVLVAR